MSNKRLVSRLRTKSSLAVVYQIFSQPVPLDGELSWITIRVNSRSNKLVCVASCDRVMSVGLVFPSATLLRGAIVQLTTALDCCGTPSTFGQAKQNESFIKGASQGAIHLTKGGGYLDLAEPSRRDKGCAQTETMAYSKIPPSA